MLMTTNAPPLRACPTRARWPAWREPMVGTKAMLRPPRRASATAARTSAIRSATFISEAVVAVGIAPAHDIVAEATDRSPNILGHGRVTLQELRREAVGEAEQVEQDEHLAIAARSRADADRRDAHGVGHGLRDVRRHEL